MFSLESEKQYLVTQDTQATLLKPGGKVYLVAAGEVKLSQGDRLIYLGTGRELGLELVGIGSQRSVFGLEKHTRARGEVAIEEGDRIALSISEIDTLISSAN